MTFNEAFDLSIKERKGEFIDNGIAVIMENIAHANADLDLSMKILDEVAQLEAMCYESGLLESAGNAAPGPVPTEDKAGSDDNAKPRDDDKRNIQRQKFENAEIQDKVQQIMKLLSSKLASDGDPRSEKQYSYQPAPGISIVQTMSDMSFPKNIVFFIETVVTWIKNLIKYALTAIKRFFMMLLGGGGAGDDLKKKMDDMKEDLKLEFKKTKVIQSVGLPVNFNNSGKITDPIIAVRTVKDSEIEKVGSLFENTLNEFEFGKDNRVSGQPVVISLDLSKDVFALKEFVQHFFNLYDNAYGSNEEYLFGVDDVEVLLKAFQVMDSNIRSGKQVNYSIGGRIAEADLIDADRMRDVAIKTKINTDALTKAYTETYNKIKDILRVIQAKSMSSVIDNMSSFRLLSNATVGATLDLLDVIKPRISEASRLEKDLEKISKMYDKLIIGLQKTGNNIMGAYGKVTYMSSYQNQMSNLFNAARYTSQTISMRISALALYLKQLKDIADIIELLKRFKKKSFLGLTKAD